MIGNTGVGLFVTDDISFQLKTGDRFLTINDKNIFNINQDEWNTIKISVAFPVEAVVIRQRNKFSQSGPGSGPGWCWWRIIELDPEIILSVFQDHVLTLYSVGVKIKTTLAATNNVLQRCYCSLSFQVSCNKYLHILVSWAEYWSWLLLLPRTIRTSSWQHYLDRCLVLVVTGVITTPITNSAIFMLMISNSSNLRKGD